VRTIKAAFLMISMTVPALAQTADEQFTSQTKSLLEQCQQLRFSGRVRGFVGSVKCSNPGLAQLAQTYRVADGDVVALYLAKRLEIAERMDAGRLTEGLGQIEMVRAYQEAAQIQQARRQTTANIVAQQNAQAQAAAREIEAQRQANIQRGLQTLQNTFGPQNYWVPQFPQPQQQRSLTCTTYRGPSTAISGPVLNCN
jgi:ABC-type phosphate transport system auxiliary subunit